MRYIEGMLQVQSSLPSIHDEEALRQRARKLLQEKAQGDAFHLKISQQGRWFTLEGRVESQHIKSKIIEIVPEVQGARWIVDRIHVGPETAR